MRPYPFNPIMYLIFYYKNIKSDYSKLIKL